MAELSGLIQGHQGYLGGRLWSRNHHGRLTGSRGIGRDEDEVGGSQRSEGT